MPSARTTIFGSCLKSRFAVNGIQYSSRESARLAAASLTVESAWPISLLRLRFVCEILLQSQCDRRTRMRVGVPKEIKVLENRVGLTPASVRELVAHGHEVMVEREAGAGIGLADDAYKAAGAQVAPDAASVFAWAEMIVKVKEPQAAECAM